MVEATSEIFSKSLCSLAWQPDLWIKGGAGACLLRMRSMETESKVNTVRVVYDIKTEVTVPQPGIPP